MPVNVLLCEGVYHSPDRIVLSRLLKGYCQIMPIGSKRNMLNQIEVRRRESRSKIYGLQESRGFFQRVREYSVSRLSEIQINNVQHKRVECK